MGKLAQLSMVVVAMLLAATLTGCVLSIAAGSLTFDNNVERGDEEPPTE